MQTRPKSQGRCLIALDIGTGGCRAVVYSPKFENLGEATGSSAVHVSKQTWVEVDTNAALHAVQVTLTEAATVARVNNYEIVGVAISGMPSSLVLLDAQGHPLGAALTWADARAAEEAKEVTAEFEHDAYERTGCPSHSSYLPAKLRWMRKNRPDVVNRAAHIGSLKEYIVNYLTGEWAVDRATAAASGLLDTAQMVWDEPLLAWLGLNAGSFSQVVLPTYQMKLTAQAGSRVGIPAGTPVIIGATDGVLAHLGSGCLQAGQASCTVSTDAAIRVTTSRRTLDTQERTRCYPLLVDYWVVGGGLSNGGNILDWTSRVLGVSSYSTLIEQAETVPPGANGLLFLPYLYGSRSPFWRDDLRGVMFGLRPNHDRGAIVRATLEGILFAMQAVHVAVEEQLGHIAKYHASGGYTQSRIWLQMQADIFGCDIAVPSTQSGTTIGTAMIGWLALGELKRLEDAAFIFHAHEPREYHPDAARHKEYQKYIKQFEMVRSHLLPVFTALAREDGA